jgi:hypothetical protein
MRVDRFVLVFTVAGGALSATVVVGCACSAAAGNDDGASADGGPPGCDDGPCADDGLASTADASDGSHSACAPDQDGTGGLTMCLANCQSWGSARLPGWDVATWCAPNPDLPHGGPPWSTCLRADSCGPADAGVGQNYCEDAGSNGFVCSDGIVCTCGDGPACAPGFQCARPIGSTSRRTCVCAGTRPDGGV